jgi:hypothetical protein
VRTITLASLSALLLAAALAGPAAAAKPIKEPTPLDPSEIPAGVTCDFAVRIESVGKPKSITFDRRDGALRVNSSGRIVSTITNVDTGASVTRDSSGPGRVSRNAAGHIVLRYGGATVFPLFDGDVTGRGLILFKGGTEFELGDDEFTVIRADLPVNVEDLCQTLG